VQDDHHPLTVMRYAEANPLRAKMVEKAEAWPWSSFGGGTARDGTTVQLEPCPVDKPSDWAEVVNEAMDPLVLERVQLSLQRGRPFPGPMETEEKEEESEDGQAESATTLRWSVPLRVSVPESPDPQYRSRVTTGFLQSPGVRLCRKPPSMRPMM
jgi:hypothetical protein